MRRGVRLGLDVGSVRIGVAVCDPDGLLATPLQTIPANRNDGSDLVTISDLVGRLGIIEVVIGWPLQLSGHPGTAANIASGYAERVCALIAPVSVRLVDERLSTVQASAAMRVSGRSTRQQKSVIDQGAAMAILQTALDAERATGRPPGVLVGHVSGDSL